MVRNNQSVGTRGGGERGTVGSRDAGMETGDAQVGG